MTTAATPMSEAPAGPVAGIFFGLNPAVTALVLHAAHRIGTRALKNRWMWGIAAASFVAIFAFDTPFPAIVLAAALIGHSGARRWLQVFALGGGHGSAKAGYGPALIDDNTPTPVHAHFSRSHLAKVLGFGLGLWVLAMAGLVALYGLQGTLAQMGWSFTKAALLTFGGAYAVLPYVYRGAVETHQWLSGPQMIDGLALGETTPGPLIMLVAFVGFVGGWLKQVFGPEALFLGGAVAATVVTFFTFLPSFVFILAGGPLVEATHGKLGFTAPLSAITAAVVGVILNLPMFFAHHELWPQGFGGRFDALSAVITLAAAVALFRFKVGVIPLLGACAGIGLLSTWLLGSGVGVTRHQAGRRRHEGHLAAAGRDDETVGNDLALLEDAVVRGQRDEAAVAQVVQHQPGRNDVDPPMILRQGLGTRKSERRPRPVDRWRRSGHLAASGRTHGPGRHVDELR